MEKILTVRGPIEPSELGQTLFHEHIFADLREHWIEPETAQGRASADAPVTAELLATLRRYPFSTTLDNLVLGDEGLAIRELGYFQRAGGSAVVDVTSIGLRRDPLGLARVARATGLHIVMGGGAYVERAHPEWIADASLDELAERFRDDVLLGAEGTRIRTGVIGEIGVSGFRKGGRVKEGHMTAEEEKVLRAGGRAAVMSGAAVSVHVDLRSEGGYQVIDVLEEEGLSPDRVVLCHMDFVESLDYHRNLVRRGAYVEYSSFGREYYEDHAGISWGHDRTRIEMIAALCQEGFADRVLIGHDVCMKMDLRTFGGNGYGHIPTAIVDRMRRHGIAEEALYLMLVDNPRRVLTIDFDEEVLGRIEADYRFERPASVAAPSQQVS
jgi:phosphotriesterase-related protein